MKKRILSILLCLLMVCTMLPVTALADDVTFSYVNYVTMTTTFAAPTLNGEVTQYYSITEKSNPYVRFGYSKWQKWNGTEWKEYNETTFTAGKYCYKVQLRIENPRESTTPYDLTRDARLLINGIQWAEPTMGGGQTNYVSGWNNSDTTYGYYSFKWYISPEYVLGEECEHEWDEGKLISEATYAEDAKMLYTCKKCNATKEVPVENSRLKPTEVAVNEVTMSSEFAAPTLNGKVTQYYSITEKSNPYARFGYYKWQKWNGTEWKEYNETTFTAGKYCYKVQLRIENPRESTTPYDLTRDARLLINGIQWAEPTMGGGQTNYVSGWNNSDTTYGYYSFKGYISPVYECKEGENPVVPVEGVTVSPSTVSLKRGESVTLAAAVSPENATNKTVTWARTSGSDKISVDKAGKVTVANDAEIGSTAVITASADGKTAACTVTVVGHDHSTVFVEQVDATCAEEGRKAYYVCECGKKFSNAEATLEIVDEKTLVIPMSDHTWNSGTETTAATCTKEGVKTFTCTVCTATKTEPIAKLAHKAASGYTRDAAYHWRVCAYGCGTIVTEKAAHIFDNDRCIVCGYSNSRIKITAASSDKKETNPNTGAAVPVDVLHTDNGSRTALGIAVLSVSGTGIAAAVIGKKRKSSVK